MTPEKITLDLERLRAVLREKAASANELEGLLNQTRREVDELRGAITYAENLLSAIKEAQEQATSKDSA